MSKSLRVLFSCLSLTVLFSSTQIRPLFADSFQTKSVFQNQLHSFGGDTTLLINHAKQMGYDWIVGQPWNKSRAHKAKAAGLHVMWNSNKEYPKYVRVNLDGTRYNVGQGPNKQGWPITAEDEVNFNNMFCMKKNAVNPNGTINQNIPLQDRFYTWKKTSEIIFYANMQCSETPPLLVEYNKKLFEDHGGPEIFDGLFIDGVGASGPNSYWYLPCYNPCLNGGADYTQREGEIEYIKQMKEYFIDQLGLDGWSGNPWVIHNYKDAWPTLPIDLLYVESGRDIYNNPASWGIIPAHAVAVQISGLDGNILEKDYPTALKALGPAGASGAWFGWYGEAEVENSTNSTQLARAIPNWDNLVGATGRSWDSVKRVYRSSNSYADPNVIYGRHAKTGKIFVVFQNTQSILTLTPGEVVTDVKRVDSIFQEVADGLTDLAITNSRVMLVNTRNMGKGYVLTTAMKPNSPPIADAGRAQTVNTGAVVRLDGTGSKDADGDPLTYSWQMTSVPSGSNATLVAPKAVNSSFVADQVGQYVIRLQVNDGKTTSAPAVVTINAVRSNSPPVAHSQTLTTSTTKAVETVLSGSDPDGDPLTFQITIPPVNGTLSGLPPKMMYNPKPSFNGDDLIVFRAHDGQAESPAAIVSVKVNSPTTPTPPTPKNLVLNPSFEESLAFRSWVTPKTSTWVNSTLSIGSAPHGTISAQVNVKTTGQAADVELRQLVPLSPKGVYRLRFWAKASSNRLFTTLLMQDIKPWGTVGLWKRVSLSSQWQQFDMVFTHTGVEPVARLAFRMGDQIGTVWIDNVELIAQP